MVLVVLFYGPGSVLDQASLPSFGSVKAVGVVGEHFPEEVADFDGDSFGLLVSGEFGFFMPLVGGFMDEVVVVAHGGKSEHFDAKPHLGAHQRTDEKEVVFWGEEEKLPVIRTENGVGVVFGADVSRRSWHKT